MAAEDDGALGLGTMCFNLIRIRLAHEFSYELGVIANMIYTMHAFLLLTPQESAITSKITSSASPVRHSDIASYKYTIATDRSALGNVEVTARARLSNGYALLDIKRST